MKKIYVFALATLCVAETFAQPVITQTNSSPIIGESYTYTRANWNGVSGGVGANQTWDYSALVEISTTDFTFIDPSAAPSPSSFVGATITANYMSGTQYENDKITSAGFEKVGFYAGGVAIPYSDPEKILEFPFTFNDNFTDPFGGTFVNGVTWNRTGTVTVTADGYGTLMLPNSTVSDVLRVKVVEDYGDWTGGSEVYHYNIEVYFFYKAGVHIPILGLTHYTQGTTDIKYANYYNDATLTAEKQSLELVSIYPNPVSSTLNINLNAATTHVEMVQIFNVAGTLVYSSTQPTNSIEVTEFQSGIYFLHLWDGENRVIKKFVKE